MYKLGLVLSCYDSSFFLCYTTYYNFFYFLHDCKPSTVLVLKNLVFNWSFCDYFYKALCHIWNLVCSWPLTARNLNLCTVHVYPIVQEPATEVFYPIFNNRFDHLETLLAIHRPRKSFVNWVTVRTLCPLPNLNVPEGLHIIRKLSCFIFKYVIIAS